LSSLQFEEFSWDDGNGGYQLVKTAYLKKLLYYMITLYPQIIMIDEHVPYLLIWCEDSVPESSKRPLLIGGLLGVWLVHGRDDRPPELIPGYLGNLGITLELEDDLAEDIRKYHLPKTETLCRLMREHFPDAIALTSVDSELQIELPEIPASEHGERLQKFPGWFSHKDAPRLLYHNGFLITGQQNKRLKQPMPQKVDGQYDDTDYVAAQGHFQPGSMLCDDSGGMVTAGILVEKGDERRLTVSIHCWQKELDEIPEKMGDSQCFRVTQGKTHVGHVSSRLGNTDIGLATLNDNVEFRNRFIDLPGGPTQLLHSDMFKLGDVYIMDSFTTGRQGAMSCRGKRTIREEDKKRRVDQVLKGKQKDLPGPGDSLVIVQGIFATSEPTAYGEPIIRAGCCGSALVRLESEDGKSTPSKQGSSSKQSTPNTKGIPRIEASSTPNKSPPGIAASSELHSKEVQSAYVHNGKIGGFMHWSDLQEKTNYTNIPRLFCYAEVADPLIEAGWEVVKTVEKRKRTGSGSGSEDPFMD
jgi:hypothetical protein